MNLSAYIILEYSVAVFRPSTPFDVAVRDGVVTNSSALGTLKTV